MPQLDISPTPNPNSLKCTLRKGAFIPEGMESFRSAEEAAGHALGERLFGVEGVTDVFIVPQFLTITKSPAAHWDDILPAVQRAVREVASKDAL